MKTIGPRPSNPSDISFADRCFAKVGERTEFVVLMSAGRGGPRVFSDRDAANAFAARCGREVSERTTPIMQRVSWT